MPRVAKKKIATVKKTVGRPVRGAENRVELRRHRASTSLRVNDRALAGFEKLAKRWGMSLGEAFERIVDTAVRSEPVALRRDAKSPLGWS